MRKRLTFYLILLPFFADDLPAHNARFALRFNGPCGETIVGPAGSTYDDGTGGKDLFFEPEPFWKDEK